MYHLIIADDEEKICEGIARLFPWEQIGFQVEAEMHSGQEILDFLKKKETRVDVILCDIQMPGIDGLEVCRQASRLSNARIVLFSSHQNYEYFRKAIQYHAVDYLLKPIGYEDLVACFGKIREELDRECGVEQESSRASQSHYDRMVEQVTDYIHENYRDASLEKAAVLVGLSQSHLSRTFKEKSGTGFAELLVQVRMEKASEMLSDVRCKSYEVAYEVGYDNPKNFSRAFKTYYGKSPSEYRKEKMGGLEA
ncbi:MAG: response regulator [Lachnospiraceae bacterium]